MTTRKIVTNFHIHHQYYYYHKHQHRHSTLYHHIINQLSHKNVFFMFLSIVLTIHVLFVDTTKFKLCHQSPKLRFYDIASHLNEQTINSLNITNTNNNDTQQQILPNPKYFRTLFSNDVNSSINHTKNQNNDDHVTVIALSSLNDERANTDAWINNLEHIYHNLVEQKSFINIRFILINSKDSYNPIWVNRIRKKVSFEVYQELPSSPIANFLDGDSGDVYIFDRCNLLAYYIRFPLSFIDRRDPFFQATILAAHTDSPCKEKCSQQRSNATNSAETNDTSIETTTSVTPVDSAETTNQTDSKENESSDNSMNVLSQMGEILKIFYNRYTMNFEPEHESTTEIPPTLSMMNTTKPINMTTNLIDTLNRTYETYYSQKSNHSEEPVSPVKVSAANVGIGELREKFGSPIQKNQTKLSDFCQKTNCSEWTTEKLLAARLCCLSITTEDDDDEPMVNVNTTVFIPKNGGFGCKLYPRTTCSMIKPVLRCCTRKLVNEYFNYAIQLRERQRQQFGYGLGQRSVRSNSNLENILLQRFMDRTSNNQRQQKSFLPT